MFENATAVTLNGKALKKLAVGAAVLWEKVEKLKGNLLPYATDTDRKTIYNGIGYKPGVRLSSSGSLSTVTTDTDMCTSGFIPAKAGDIVRIKNFSMNSWNAYIIAYDASNAKTGYAQIHANYVDELDKTTADYFCKETLTASTYGSNFNAIRVSGVFDADTIVTINEEIT